jgi:hypothetical protein
VETPADFDRYVAEHGIPEEERPEALARWIAERTGGPVPRFERVRPEKSKSLKIASSVTLTGYPRCSRCATMRPPAP